MKRRSMQRGLVLGGSGFLGAEVVRQAVAAGHALTSVCRNPGPAPESARGQLRLQSTDLTDLLAMRKWFEELSPDWVINCAALSRAGACEREPELAHSLNALVPAELSLLCAGRGLRLVHVSTDLVFDGEPLHETGYREDDLPRPLSVYGESKRAGEVLVLNKPGVVVRLPLLFGDSNGRGLGASDSLVAAVERGETPALFSDERRTPLDVEDAAAALLELVESDLQGLLHVAGPRPMTRLELGLVVLRGSGRSPEEAQRLVRPALQAEFDVGAPRPRDVSLDASLARSVLKTRLSSPEERLSPPAG